MGKKTLLISWLIVLLIGLIAFSPIKIPDFNNEFDKPNKIIVSYQSCTCCPPFRIVKGEIDIPDNLKHNLKNKNYEVSVSGASPLNALGENFSISTYQLLIANNFILEGKITVIDSAECESHPIFTVSKWTTEKYNARYLTWSFFEFVFVILYPIIFVILLVFTGFYIYRKKNLTSNSAQ